MAYNKTNWTDRVVQFVRRYVMTLVSGNTYDLTPSEGNITSAGTPMTASLLNKMETGIYDAHVAVDTHIANKTNPHSVTTAQIGALPATSYTASDVLVKVKSVDGSGSGLDADLLDNKESTDFMSANKVYGTTSFSDAISANGTVTKTIYVGSDYKNGSAIFNDKLFVNFSTNNLKTQVHGLYWSNGMTGYYNYYWTREQKGWITDTDMQYTVWGFRGAGDWGSYVYNQIEILECYLNNGNITIVFKNPDASNTRNIGCTIYWEVW